MANHNKAPYDLIKKRAENKGLLAARTNAQLTTKHSKHSTNGQLLPKNKIQSNSNSAQNQSTFYSALNQSTLSQSEILQLNETSISTIKLQTKSQKDTRNFTGGFIPKELKTNEPRGRAVSFDWTNTSDREESLSDPRWHKRPQTKDRQMKKNKSSPQHTPTTKVIDARNLITGTKTTKFPKIFFGDTETVTKGGCSQTTVPLITQATTATQTTLQSFIRPVLVQYTRSPPCSRRLPSRRRKDRNPLSTPTNNTGEPSSHTPGISSHVGSEPTCLVSAHPSRNCANGTKL